MERKQNHVDFTFRLLQCLVEPTDLQQVQATPIGKVRGGKIQVIVRFSTYRQRNLVFSAKRNLKNHKDNVFIT
jgi:hypothetical protein